MKPLEVNGVSNILTVIELRLAKAEASGQDIPHYIKADFEEIKRQALMTITYMRSRDRQDPPAWHEILAGEK